MSNIPNHLESSEIQIIAPVKYAIFTVINTCVKSLRLVDTSLDMAQDVVDTGKVYSSSMKRSAILSTEQQLALAAKAIEAQS